MKKGFTLIELLAVILILGIIALIAIPQVTNVIGSASKGAAETSAKHYVDAVTNKIALSKLQVNSSESLEDGVYKAEDISVDITGEGPTSGTVIIGNGMVKYANVEVNGYTVTCHSNGKCHAAQYVYFQRLEGFTSFDQTVPEIPTEYKAYLRINKDDITDVQSCFNDEGKEFCFSPNEFEKTREVIYGYFGFDPTDTSSWYHDQEEYDDGFIEGYYKTINDLYVKVEFYDWGIEIDNEVVGLRLDPEGGVLVDVYYNDRWFTCYLEPYEPEDDKGCALAED